MSSDQDRGIEIKLNTIQAYKRVFDGPDGKLVLWDLIKSARLLTSAAGSDELDTYKNIGRQEIILQIMQTIEMDIERYVDFFKEMRKKEDYNAFKGV